jgi:hypothetical protein
MVEREANRLAGNDVEARGSGRPVHPEVGRCGKQEPVGSTTRCYAARDHLENRVDQAVFRTRSIGNLDLQLPVGTGEAAQQYPRRPGTQVVAAVIAANRHGVSQHRGACRGPERGLQRHRLVHVGAAGLKVVGWPDRKVPAIGIEDAGEHGWRVETRETQPVHRAGPADQRRRAAVRQQAIVADRQAVHRNSLL